MKIKKIKLIGGGFGGAHITTISQEEKNKRVYFKEVTEKIKRPIHLGLENKIKELRPFLLNLCAVLRGDEDKMTKDYVIMETDITALQIVIDTTEEEGTGFILEGTKSVLNGNKEVKFKTPKIEAGDGYDDFDAVQLIIKEVVSEVMVYLSGDILVTDSEALIRWYEKKGKGEKQLEKIKAMTPEEQKQELTKILEGMGSIVIHQSDVSVDEEEEEEVNEEVFKIEPEKEVVLIKK